MSVPSEGGSSGCFSPILYAYIGLLSRLQGAETFAVKLHVYDLSQGMARQLSVAFLGVSIDAIYHTGVVVYGKEYWFGAGIEQGHPGRTYFGPPLQTLHLGETAIPPELFAEYLSEIGPKFNVSTYSLLRNNCNHFSHEVAQFLVGEGIPRHIVDLPDVVLNSPQGPLLGLHSEARHHSKLAFYAAS